MKLIAFLRTELTVSKPVVPYEQERDSQGWMCRENTSALAEFFDDWRRYGFSVACFNIAWLWRKFDCPRPE